MRGAVKQISKKNLKHNLNILKQYASNSQCIAVIKANAYGSEAEKIIDALDAADMFAMATTEEALKIRKAGSTKQILLLEGVFEESELKIAYDNNFEVVIAAKYQLDWLINFPEKFNRVWFKIDTGMGRLGFRDEASSMMDKLLTKYNEEQIVIMTHFSSSDSADRSITNLQIEKFDYFAKNYPKAKNSLCNSAGIMAYPDAHRDFVRPGISLYGVSPFEGNYAEDHDLRPVMTLKSRVLSVKKFKKGDAIGYSQTYKMQQDGLIAICEIGYADGYSRFIPEGAPILINGKEYKKVARVAMDMTSVLVDDTVCIGDEVILWGDGLPIEKICEYVDSNAHQLLTLVTDRPIKKFIELTD